MSPGDGFQDEEEHQRGEKEGDDRHDEGTPVDVDGLGEVGKRGVGIERVHDRRESGADDHTYCKPHDVAAGDEFLEFGEELGHFEFSHSDILLSDSSSLVLPVIIRLPRAYAQGLLYYSITRAHMQAFLYIWRKCGCARGGRKRERNVSD